MAKEKFEKIERKVYYFPLYCQRKWPSITGALSDFLGAICRGEKISLYKTELQAAEVGASMLCDDDCYGVFEVDFTSASGYLILKYQDVKFITSILYSEKLNNYFQVIA